MKRHWKTQIAYSPFLGIDIQCISKKKNCSDLTDIVVYETRLILLTAKSLSCDKKDSFRATVCIDSKSPTSSYNTVCTDTELTAETGF